MVSIHPPFRKSLVSDSPREIIEFRARATIIAMIANRRDRRADNARTRGNVGGAR